MDPATFSRVFTILRERTIADREKRLELFAQVMSGADAEAD